jgi:2'-5' RNA ligase
MERQASATRRIFVAVPLPPEAEAFALRAQRLVPRSDGLRLLRREQLHVTLAFVGEADERRVRAAQRVVEEVEGVRKAEVILGGFLAFPTERRARVIALDLGDPSGVLTTLYERVAEGLEGAGVMQREARPFKPHVSVARLRVPRMLQPTSESGRVRFAVESVCLYRSELKQEGAVYTVISRTALAGG